MVTAYPTKAVVTATDLSTDPDVFPILPGRDFLVGKTPMFSTGRRRAASGREIRNAYWSSPLWKFSVRHNVIRDRAALPELAKLAGFFNSRQGGFGHFFFQDPNDYVATAEPFGTGNGTQMQFQLQRTVNKGGVYATAEPVYGLWENPTILVGGSPAGSYTLSPWGVVTFASAPASGAALTWSGKFLYVCAFEEDEMTLEQMYRDLWSQSGLTFRSLKP